LEQSLLRQSLEIYRLMLLSVLFIDLLFEFLRGSASLLLFKSLSCLLGILGYIFSIFLADILELDFILSIKRLKL
jgi:hypothetical protein